MRAFLEFIAQAMLDDPSAVQIKEIRRGPVVKYFMKVPQAELGRLIGRDGHLAEAMRQVMRAAAPPRRKVDLRIESLD
ncbi:KH domain-containing protein [Thermoflexus sp.]|uniref:KH domain-containing protein n=1 Tax=Thermoflexus sp. TaxID=1969742 RepID=UPI0035E3F538